jgi:hypothetical protein
VVQNKFAEIELRAKRRLGGMLRQLVHRGGDRRSEHHTSFVTLTTLGVTRSYSRRSRAIAAISERTFEEYLSFATDSGVAISFEGLTRYAYDRRVKPNRVSTTQGSTKKSPTPALTNRNRLDQDDASADIGVASMISDARNHLRLIENIVQPVCTDTEKQFSVAERHGLARYVAELRNSLIELTTAVGDSQ